ncbi:MAG: hypothetical protein HYT93_03205 [Parcubacteria group bacterium]|nr:hypothetical protein [Parcubacteria group bacterium]
MQYIPGEIIVRFAKRVSTTEARDVIEKFFELRVKEFIQTQDGLLYWVLVDDGREEAMILGFKKLASIVIDVRRNHRVAGLKTL